MMDVILLFGLTLLLAWPLGRYMARVFKGERTWLDPLLNPLENGLYRLMGVDATKGMTWRGYAVALVMTNLLVGAIAYFVFILQGFLPLNPDGISGMRWDLSLHTVSSFITNTNQQHYSGQSGLSYFSQMLGITAMQAFTPIVALVALVAILRGLFGGRNAETAKPGEPRDLGNYYVDMTRGLTRIMLPLAFVLALLLTWQGVPSTFSGAKVAHLVDPPSAEETLQVIPVGPVAPMVAVKQLGTNGGGWYGMNSATPMENPTPLSNLFEMIGLFLIPLAGVFMLGHLTGRMRFAMMILAVMVAMSIPLTTTAIVAENMPNRAFHELAAPGPNLEGKEVRLGATASALFGTMSTQVTIGSVNSMHDSWTPIGGMVPIIGMLINGVYGGVGAGLINFLIYIVVAVFIAGLMVGRTPELFGRKIEAKEIKLAAVALLLSPFLILGFTAVTLALPDVAHTSNPLFHGISQVFYEYTSANANNGSGFEGLGDNTYWWNITCSVVLILARFIPFVAPLAIAGFLGTKRVAPEGSGTLRVDTPIFGATTLALIVIVTLLNFAPVLVLGPIAEHYVETPKVTPIPADLTPVSQDLSGVFGGLSNDLLVTTKPENRFSDFKALRLSAFPTPDLRPLTPDFKGGVQ